MIDLTQNFTKAHLKQGISAADTLIYLLPGEVSKLPQFSAGNYPTGAYNLVIYNATDYTDPSDDPNVEIVRVMSLDLSSDTIIVARGQEGTIASAHNLGNKTYKLILSVTKNLIDEITTSINSVPYQKKFIMSNDTISTSGLTSINVTHNLGIIPKVIRIKAFIITDSNNTISSFSDSIIELTNNGVVSNVKTNYNIYKTSPAYAKSAFNNLRCIYIQTLDGIFSVDYTSVNTSTLTLTTATNTGTAVNIAYIIEVEA